MMKKLFYLFTLLLSLTTANAAPVSIIEQGGWFESGYITWTGDNQNYTVSIRPEGGEYQVIDKELVRKYADYYRADMVGLKAGNYQFKIVGANSESAESAVFYATAHDRSGFAHVGYSQGIGAYKNDGTLKDGARVIYVTANTAKTVKCNVFDGKNDLEYTGLQAILKAFEKGKETRPLAIRIIGTVKASDCDSFGSSAEGIQVKGKSGSTDMNITIEGIGNDATTHGFGFLVRNACCVEFRNFANMVCMDDCVSLDTDNHHVWVHNMDFFYGGTGGDADQAKGDGTVDIKGKSSHITISYNHFYDSGKCSLGGMKGETTDCWMTYHHNWFDHSDSRHPRIRTAFYHSYNNYYDGNSKYGVGVTSGGSAFVEANYFRNCKYPMLISKQGTDAEGDGTFSGEDGGVNKAFNNVIINPRKIQYYDGSQTDGKWDAVLVENRNDAVTAKAFTGGTSYNATADAAARSQYIENKMDAPEDIPAIVRGELGAGRLQHGDFKWTFNNSLQDENYDVISDLKQALVNYEGTVVSFADGTAISSRTPATSTVNGGDGKGLDQETNDSYVPSWAGGGGSISTGKQVIGVDGNFFFFNAENQAQVNTYMTNATSDGGPSTIMTNGTFNPTREIINSTSGSCSDYKGSILIAQNGYLTMYYEAGISSIAFYTSGNGSQKWQLETSTDGNTFAKSGSAIEAKSSGAHPNVSGNFDPAVKYVRITNLASGGRDVQGVKVYTPAGASDLTALTTSDIELTQGQTYTLTLGTDYTTSSTGAISYKSNAAKIASVDENGKISALTEGTAVITLTQAADDTHDAAEIKFTVKVADSRAASDIALTSEAEITVVKGETAQITATGTNQANFTYTSGAPSIATVDATGKVTAVAFGTATIIVSDPGTETMKPGTKTVTVTVPDNRTASNLAVEKDELSVDRNSTVQINVTKHDGTITYRSVDEEIATVDENGLVTGLLAGEATIVVSDAGSDAAKAGSLNVTVLVNDTRAESQLAVTSGTKVSIDMAVSKTANILTTGATGALTYDVDDESIISVNNEGVITAIKGGTTTVTIFDAGNDSFKPGSVVVTVDVTAIPPAEPVTWAVNNASTLKAGTSISSGQIAVFISTDETGMELQYMAGSSCKIDKGIFKMGGATQNFGKDGGNRYFILPALSGSGMLTITYGSSNATDVKVHNAYSASEDAVVATITSTITSVRLEDLDNTVLYLTASPKAYFNGITWTPDANQTPKAESTFALTSNAEVSININETSDITTENAAGTVTYASDKPGIATVDANGQITGVADGVAVITVTDPGSETIKGKTLTVTVTVGSGVEPKDGKTWDFTQPLSATDLANLEADYEVVPKSDTDDTPSEGATTNKNWYKVTIKIDTDENVSRYGNGKVLANKVNNALTAFVAIKANGTELELLNGLTFARYNNKLDTKSIRIDAGYRLNTNASNLAFKIPSLKKDDVVYIDYASASTTAEDRTLTPTNGTGENLTSNSSSDRKIAKITVSADGDLIVQQSKGMNYYKIYLNPAEVPTAIQTVSAKTATAVKAGKYVKNGKLVIVRDGKQYNVNGVEIR